VAYNDFTLEMLIEQFDLEVREESDLFAGLPSVPISDLLRQSLQEHVPFALEIGTEKARSEFIIAPVLAEVRRQLQPGVSLFSGVEFSVDASRGLLGVCDFLFSLSPLQLTVQAPVVTVVEAKNDNLKAGISQCLAEMVGAQVFNKTRGNAIPSVYGVVTTGTNWRFMRLTGAVVSVDTSEYYLREVERVVGVLVALARKAREQALSTEGT
jgi:hypothetical protein